MTNKVYKLNEWQSPSGRWYVAHTDNMKLSRWWMVPHALGKSYEEYIQMLIEQYHASHIKFFTYQDKRNSFLSFSFDKYTDAHRYLLDMNRVFRKLNWTYEFPIAKQEIFCYNKV